MFEGDAKKITRVHMRSVMFLTACFRCKHHHTSPFWTNSIGSNQCFIAEENVLKLQPVIYMVGNPSLLSFWFLYRVNGSTGPSCITWGNHDVKPTGRNTEGLPFLVAKRL